MVGILNRILIRKFNHAALSKFKWNIPKKFNFAKDVIDKHAADSGTSKSIAFHHKSNITGTRKWTFEEFSHDSKHFAGALQSLGQIGEVGH